MLTKKKAIFGNFTGLFLLASAFLSLVEVVQPFAPCLFLAGLVLDFMLIFGGKSDE